MKMPLMDLPFDRVTVDLVGPVTPASDRGNRFILVMVDYATRYPEAVALKKIRTEAVAEVLWDMWARSGIPREVLSDRGSQFTSKTMKEVHRLLAVEGKTTTPYHAQCNGRVERFNATLKSMISKLFV
jgi:transposase InsO family protein